MASKLFAFTVSKKIEPLDPQARNQWIGDGNARADPPVHCRGAYCSTGQGYGLAGCESQPGFGYCDIWGGGGYYICDCPFG